MVIDLNVIIILFDIPLGKEVFFRFRARSYLFTTFIKVKQASSDTGITF